MQVETRLKLQNILIISVCALLFGLLYNYFYYPHSFTEFAEAGTIGVLIGLIVGFLEQFILYETFQKRSFLKLSAVRATLYAFLTSVILCLVLSIEISMLEEISYFAAIQEYLKTPNFKRDFIFTFAFIILMLFLFMIIVLIGKTNFLRLIIGSYHRPREVHRIFMFVDIKGSTSIAEKLSNKDYSAFIKDYFYDISDAIILFKGEVYQYVGDEMIVVWPIRNRNLNCIRCFYKMVEIIQAKSDRYQSKYGLVPEFKAGMHIGPVIITSVGKQKRELVYHGDVLNTTSRIEGKCNVLRQNLLISEDLLIYLEQNNEFTYEEKGEIELRGKAQKLRLYGVHPIQT